VASDQEKYRTELARLAARPATRQSEWTEGEPCEWTPHTVTDPRTGQLFTDAGAWEFVSEQLLGGCSIEEVELRKPRGKKGFVLKLQGAKGKPLIYVKLRICPGYVKGRSFHYDIYERQV
jgi:hypothetical protein